jgi:hypothetical protein
VAADEKVGAAQEMAALGAGGELSPSALGQRPQARGGYLLPFSCERKRAFGLGQAGSRSLELAGGSRGLSFPLPCALLLALIEGALEEGDGRCGQAQPVLGSVGRKRLLERVGNPRVDDRARCQ